MHKAKQQHIGAAEAASILQRDRSTITRWTQAGKLKPIYKGTGLRGTLIFRRSDVERLRDQMKTAA